MIASVAQLQCNGLPRDGPGFDSQWVLCINRASLGYFVPPLIWIFYICPFYYLGGTII